MSSVLAIDVGTRELKLLEGDAHRLMLSAEILLPDGAVQEGVPTPLLTAAIRSVIESSGAKSRVARLAITDTGVAVRSFRLPSLPAAELASAVLFEGRRQVPMEAVDVHFAWHAQRDRAGYAVYLAAARRDMIDAVTSTVAAGGLVVDRIDLKPLALARGMGTSDGLLLDWQLGEATLVLMAEGRPRFFRTFLLDAPADDVETQLEELSFSLSALVKFIRSAEPNVPLGPTTQLWVGGRFAFLPDGVERAQERFGFELRSPRPPLKAPPGLPWQAHLVGLGLLQTGSWRTRLTPSQGGDNRVAA